VANRFFNPNEQFCDSTGLPYAGGTLDFYASGTSTRLNTYSDSALSIANTNPVVLDSAGRANSIFLQNLAYKVVLSDVNSNVIWTYDPVFASDYSTRALLTTGFGSPNGVVAGTAGSSGIGANTYWDATNLILYVCTQTGTSSTAVWTAVNATAAAAIVPPPQGYLTPTSGTPIITSDVISNTTLVYTPYVGNLVPVYNGTGFVPTVFSELTLTLTSSQAANTIYDVFIFNNSGVLTLVTGPAWTQSGAGIGSRGTGAGTTQLSRLSGIWVNTVSMTGRNSSSTYTIPANQATYLGSLFIDSVAGQITLHRSFGQARKWAIWNAYNRSAINLLAFDPTANWTSAPTTWRQSRADGNNFAMAFCGLAEPQIAALFVQTITQSVAATVAQAQIAIGVNSTTGPSGLVGNYEVTNSAGTTTAVANITAKTFLTSPLGINQIYMLEQAPFGGVNNQYNGGQTNMQLQVSWLG
jgi:hypothetical protein